MFVLSATATYCTVGSLEEIFAAMSSYMEHNSSLWGFGILALCLYGCMLLVSLFYVPKIPVVGVRSKLEAGLVSNFRFYRNAEAILVEGYTKVGD